MYVVYSCEFRFYILFYAYFQSNFKKKVSEVLMNQFNVKS